MAAQIEEKWDPQNQRAYYYDRSSGRTAWNRNSLLGTEGDWAKAKAAVAQASDRALAAGQDAAAAMKTAAQSGREMLQNIDAAEAPRVALLGLTSLLSLVGFSTLASSPCFPTCQLEAFTTRTLVDDAPFGPINSEATMTVSPTTGFGVAVCVITWLWSTAKVLSYVVPTCRSALGAIGSFNSAAGAGHATTWRGAAWEILLWIFVLASLISCTTFFGRSTTSFTFNFTVAPASLPGAQLDATVTETCGYFELLKRGVLQTQRNLYPDGGLAEMDALCRSTTQIEVYVAVAWFLWLVLTVLLLRRLPRETTQPLRDCCCFWRTFTRGKARPDSNRDRGRARLGDRADDEGARRRVETLAIIVPMTPEQVLVVERRALLRLCALLALFGCGFSLSAPCFASCTVDAGKFTTTTDGALRQTSSFAFLLVANVLVFLFACALLAYERPAVAEWWSELRHGKAPNAAEANNHATGDDGLLQLPRMALFARRATFEFLGCAVGLLFVVCAWVSAAYEVNTPLDMSSTESFRPEQVCGLYTLLRRVPRATLSNNYATSNGDANSWLQRFVGLQTFDLFCDSLFQAEAAIASTFFLGLPLAILLLREGRARGLLSTKNELQMDWRHCTLAANAALFVFACVGISAHQLSIDGSRFDGTFICYNVQLPNCHKPGVTDGDSAWTIGLAALCVAVIFSFCSFFAGVRSIHAERVGGTLVSRSAQWSGSRHTFCAVVDAFCFLVAVLSTASMKGTLQDLPGSAGGFSLNFELGFYANLAALPLSFYYVFAAHRTRVKGQPGCFCVDRMCSAAGAVAERARAASGVYMPNPMHRKTEDANATAQQAKTAPVPAPWVAAVDETSGHTYYYNNDTGETTWDRPS